MNPRKEDEKSSQIDVESIKRLDSRLRLESQKFLGKDKSLKAWKNAYLISLSHWIHEESPSHEEKIGLANFLTDSVHYDPHLLSQERHKKKDKATHEPRLFSCKTTSMAKAQGMLAQGLSDKEKDQLFFNQTTPDRFNAKKAYRKAAKP